MAKKVYGKRWKVLGSLGEGGQAHVFRVRDKQDEHQGEYALKRIINPERHDRFSNEVAACRSLSHPNIVPLIDHSALSVDATDDERMYLVTKLAEHGDLSQRAQVYKGSPDSTLVVAMQLCAALAHAHEKNVIHRDVKPNNILFPSVGHDCWLADFGICLIREAPRTTQTGEVVGPWMFMAPELEGGGCLDVTPAAVSFR